MSKISSSIPYNNVIVFSLQLLIDEKADRHKATSAFPFFVAFVPLFQRVGLQVSLHQIVGPNDTQLLFLNYPLP